MAISVTKLHSPQSINVPLLYRYRVHLLFLKLKRWETRGQNACHSLICSNSTSIVLRLTTFESRAIIFCTAFYPIATGINTYKELCPDSSLNNGMSTCVFVAGCRWQISPAICLRGVTKSK